MIDLDTPPKCTADFCLIPLGTPTASVSQQIADVQRLLEQSGLKYSMHSAGTTVGKLSIPDGHNGYTNTAHHSMPVLLLGSNPSMRSMNKLTRLPA